MTELVHVYSKESGFVNTFMASPFSAVHCISWVWGGEGEGEVLKLF